MRKISKFKCKMCGQCCVGEGIVVLTPKDIERISANMKLPREDFLEKYCMKVVDAYWLKDKENSECVFLDGKVCEIQAFKPEQCEGYPNKWRSTRLIELCAGFKEDLDDDEEYFEMDDNIDVSDS